MAKAKSALQSAIATFSSNPPLRGVVAGLVGRGVLPESIWSRIPYAGRFSVVVGSGVVIEYDSVPGDAIGTRLRWGGGEAYEPETIRAYIDLLADAELVIDIGANTGLFTIIAIQANSQLQVHAFEPVPRNFQRLEANVKANAADSRCSLHRKAVSERTSTGSFHIPDNSSVPHSGSLDETGFKGLTGSVIEVETVALDDMIQYFSSVDVVKMDVEGFELSVIAGMQKLIQRFRPTLIVEIVTDDVGNALQRMLDPYGYSYFRPDSDGLKELSQVSFDQHAMSRNVVCMNVA